jgi:hypothetical protein
MTTEDDKNITETRPALRYTIPSGIQTPMALKTLPDGVCTVLLPDGEDFKQTFKVYADKDGIIRLYVSSPKESEVLKK